MQRRRPLISVTIPEHVFVEREYRITNFAQFLDVHDKLLNIVFSKSGNYIASNSHSLISDAALCHIGTAHNSIIEGR